jgi:hypothetical protein
MELPTREFYNLNACCVFARFAEYAEGCNRATLENDFSYK